MASENFASGHLMLSQDSKCRDVALKKIAMLPDEPYNHEFGVWNGIFHAPLAPCRAGYIITFGLSFKDFGDHGEIGGFLSFWEDFISSIPGRELFFCITPSMFRSEHIFGKYYYLWQRQQMVKPSDHGMGWEFCGDSHPYGDATDWTSRFPLQSQGRSR